MDNLSRIRFINEKNYLNKLMGLKNGNDEDTTDCQIASTSITKDGNLHEFELLNGVSNGMQYPPDEDYLIYYDSRYLAYFNATENKDDDGKYGVDEDDNNP